LGFSSVFAGDASPLRSWLAECVAGWLAGWMDGWMG
jgi:hypothetical protein